MNSILLFLLSLIHAFLRGVALYLQKWIKDWAEQIDNLFEETLPFDKDFIDACLQSSCSSCESICCALIKGFQPRKATCNTKSISSKTKSQLHLHIQQLRYKNTLTKSQSDLDRTSNAWAANQLLSCLRMGEHPDALHDNLRLSLFTFRTTLALAPAYAFTTSFFHHQTFIIKPYDTVHHFQHPTTKVLYGT